MGMTPEVLERLKITLLGELAKRVVRIPSSWSTAKIYDALVDDGLAAPVLNVGPLQNGYIITDKGREALITSTVVPLMGTTH